jgi:hypothetical protein
MKVIKQTTTPPLKRAGIEGQRGIVRDSSGHIIRSKEWIVERVALLEDKLADTEQRKKNIKQELLLRKGELENMN